ncbi:hypothetical protein LSTR_LSTR008495 [Laodelphax striatellus]|uniref:ER membrane protein complex subunit 4 n=1 Tax=Laodelphax striatellus TaxID=195883 RepID=A0A482WQQ2_LAOST|nr:hypothetical protein LSTR_LSTR008495 [Laodelphax striatellus]
MASSGSRSNNRRYKWALDFNYKSKQERSVDVPSPPGYNPALGQVYTETSKESDPNHLIIKKSWDLALGPLKQVSSFKMIEGSHSASQKFVYFLGNILSVGLALFKCQSMGLLPSHTSDWLAFVEPQIRMEYSGGGLLLT